MVGIEWIVYFCNNVAFAGAVPLLHNVMHDDH
jgi:hypothetical protein